MLIKYIRSYKAEITFKVRRTDGDKDTAKTEAERGNGCVISTRNRP